MCLLLSASVSLSLAAEQTASVLDSGGGVHSNAFYSGVGAVGQGTPVGFNSNPDRDNYSGFLHTFVSRPDLDNDVDGIADENDTDDDNDGLTDLVEVRGSGFDPTTITDLFNADTDNDGTGDGEESVAGTNPQDPDSKLAVIRIELQNGSEVVEWKSRRGKTYDLLRAGTIFELVSAPETAAVVTVTSGGAGPFLETSTVSTNPSTGGKVFYGVRVKP